jgi:uncharacterized protein YbaR (Trm112 family)
MEDSIVSYECCFCRQSVDAADALTLTISSAASDESQGLYCHAVHLADKIAPGIPFLFSPDLDTSEA